MKRTQKSPFIKKRDLSAKNRLKLRSSGSSQVCLKRQTSIRQTTKQSAQATARHQKLLLPHTANKLKQRQRIQAPLLSRLVNRSKAPKKLVSHTRKTSKTAARKTTKSYTCAQLSKQLKHGVQSLRQMIISPLRSQQVSRHAAAIKIQRWVRTVLPASQGRRDSVTEVAHSELVDKFKQILRQNSDEFSQLKRRRKPAWAVASLPQQFVTLQGRTAPVYIPVLDLGRVERSFSSREEVLPAKKTVSSGSELPLVSDIEPSSGRASDSFFQAAHQQAPDSFFMSSDSGEESGQDLPELLTNELFADNELQSLSPEKLASLKTTLNPENHPLISDRIDFMCSYLDTRLEHYSTFKSPGGSIKSQVQSELTALLRNPQQLI